MNRCQNVFDWFACCTPAPHGGNADSGNAGPFLEGASHPVKAEADIVSFVLGLLESVCPPAVLLAVAFGIVNPVNGHAGWAFPHISKEPCEVGAPLIADSYSTTTVVLVSDISGAVAPILHGLPCAVKWMRAATLAESMLGASCSRVHVLPATAAFCVSGPHPTERNHLFGSASASNNKPPQHSSVGIALSLGLTNHGKPRELLARNNLYLICHKN